MTCRRGCNGNVTFLGVFSSSALPTPFGLSINTKVRNEEKLRQEFGLGHTDGNGKPLLALLNEPSLNIDGFASARTGAKARCDLRTSGFHTFTGSCAPGVREQEFG